MYKVNKVCCKIFQFGFGCLVAGERRPFKCSECESQFTQYSLMVRHIEGVHKKTKRFTCSICSKSFLYKNHFSGIL